MAAGRLRDSVLGPELFVLGCFLAVVTCQQSRTEFLSLIQETPLSRGLPASESAEPSVIECDLFVYSIDSINEANMDFTVDVGIHLQWENQELTNMLNRREYDFEYLDFDAQNMKKVWVPDIYFPNEKKASVHKILMDNRMLRLYKDGKLTYITRVQATLSCRMDLRKYPFDKQVCSILLESFAYKSSKLALRWAKNEKNETAVDTASITELRQFYMLKVEHDSYIRTHAITGNHSCLRADFHLVRNIGYYVIQMYVPSLLIVMLSWLSFWLNVNSIPGRVTLGVLSVLTISTQSSTVNASLPRVSYTKAIDVWMATCLVFAFAALIEFAVVNVLSRKLPGRRFSIVNLFSVQKDGQDDSKETTVDQDGRVSVERKSKSKVVLCSTYLDVSSRYMFPLAFAIFNMVYWIYYLNVVDY